MNLEIFATGLDHPEGLAFDAHGHLWAGGEAGQIYRIDPAGNVETITQCGGFTLGIAFSPTGQLYACNPALGAVLRINNGQSETAAAGIPCPNFPAFDATGQLWVTDSGKWKQPDGRLLRIGENGVVHEHITGLGYANGLAFLNGALYMAESDTRRILRINGSQTEVVAEEVGRTPDGLAAAPDGSLWCACYATDDIWRVDPSSGEKQRIAHDPDAILLCRPTNLAFHDGWVYVCNLGRSTIVRGRVA